MLCAVLFFVLNGIVLVHTSPEWSVVQHPEPVVYEDGVAYRFNPGAKVLFEKKETSHPDEMRSGTDDESGEESEISIKARNFYDEMETPTFEKIWISDGREDSTFLNTPDGQLGAVKNRKERSMEDQSSKSKLPYMPLPGYKIPVPDVDALIEEHFGAEAPQSLRRLALDPDMDEDESFRKESSEFGKAYTLAEMNGKRRVLRQVTPEPPERGLRPPVMPEQPQSGPRPMKVYTEYRPEADAEWVPKERLQQDIFKENTPTDPVYKLFLPQTSKDYAHLKLGTEDAANYDATRLPPDYGQRPSFNLNDRADLQQMRQAGPLCGVFLNPLFHSQLRAVNQSTYILWNTFVNTRVRFDGFTVSYVGATSSTSQDIVIEPHQKSRIHNYKLYLDSRTDIEKLRQVEILDSSGRFSVYVNVSGCIAPRPLSAPGLSQPMNGLLSEYVILYTSNVLVIGGFTYPGTCPSAFFWAGRTNNPSNGFQIPMLNGSVDPLRNYTNEEVWLQLPDAYTFYDLDYVGVFCPMPRQMLGFMPLRRDYWKTRILPPAFMSEERLKIKHESSLLQ